MIDDQNGESGQEHGTEPSTQSGGVDGSGRLPGWVRLIDSGAEIVLGLIIVGGFLPGQYGYYQESLARSWAWWGCALLGCWALAGISLGRWNGESLRTARRVLLFMLLMIVWSGIQLVPIDTKSIVNLSSVWNDARVPFEKAGFEFPESVQLAHHRSNAVRGWNQLIASTAFFACACMLSRRRTCSLHMMILFAGASVLEGLIGVFNYAGGGTNRAFGAAYNPSHHAALVVMGLPIYFALLGEVNKRFLSSKHSLIGGSNPVLVLYAIGAIAGLGWLTSFSRGSLAFGTAGLLGWLAVEFWIWQRRRREQHDEATPPRFGVLGVIGAALAFVIVWGILRSASVLEGFQARGIDVAELGNDGRFELWRASIRALGESPLWGLGLGGTENALLRYAEFPMIYTPVFSHNDYVQVVTEMGLPFAVVAAIVIGAALWSLRLDGMRIRQQSRWGERALLRAVAAGVFITLAHATTDFHLRVPLVGFCFLGLLALFVCRGPLRALSILR